MWSPILQYCSACISGTVTWSSIHDVGQTVIYALSISGLWCECIIVLQILNMNLSQALGERVLREGILTILNSRCHTCDISDTSIPLDALVFWVERYTRPGPWIESTLGKAAIRLSRAEIANSRVRWFPPWFPAIPLHIAFCQTTLLSLPMNPEMNLRLNIFCHGEAEIIILKWHMWVMLWCLL